METFKTFLIIIVVVLSFGVAVVAGQNGLLSARCAARCLTEHRDSLRGGTDRNSHRKFMLDRCKNNTRCASCMKPCRVAVREIVQHKCDKYCEKGETECVQSCEFLYYTHTYKAGDCPSPESAADFEAVCLASCGVDSDCAEDKKCCPNMCGYVCRKPDYTNHNFPLVPLNITTEEKRQGKALRLSWTAPRSNRTIPGVNLLVLEHRNTTSLNKAVWNEKTPWKILTFLQSSHILLERIHAGHWYQYRVAMVTSSGTQGYSTPSTPFKSSRRVQKPSPPQNITEGATTLRKGYVDVTIHWQPPSYTDLPVWRYMLTWSERLSRASPVLIRLPVFEKTLAGSVQEFKLKKLKPGTTYHIEIEAMIQHGNRHLVGKKASKYITTYMPKNMKTDTQFISVYKDILKVEELEVVDNMPYYETGSLKAQLAWSVGADFKSLVKSFMIYWMPHSCDQEYAMPHPYSATSDVPRFEIYDLQFECQYRIRVNAVTMSGVQGKPSEIKLRTPQCRNILVKSNSLPPLCPQRVPQVPKSPRKVKPKILEMNCTVDVDLSWKHPRSDLEIASYLVTYQLTDSFKERVLNTDGTVYKYKPVEITLPKVRRYRIRGLKQSELYVIKIHAVSEMGLGAPAEIDIYTPRIFPCSTTADIQPEPPDKISRATTPNPPVFVSHVTNCSIDGSTSSVSKETVTKNIVTKYRSDNNSVTINSVTINRTTKYRTTQNPTAASSDSVPKLNAYKAVYYMLIFFSNLFSQS